MDFDFKDDQPTSNVIDLLLFVALVLLLVAPWTGDKPVAVKLLENGLVFLLAIVVKLFDRAI